MNVKEADFMDLLYLLIKFFLAIKTQVNFHALLILF